MEIRLVYIFVDVVIKKYLRAILNCDCDYDWLDALKKSVNILVE
jgi:hypothetical protein